jgi:hypothetical protein
MDQRVTVRIERIGRRGGTRQGPALRVLKPGKFQGRMVERHVEDILRGRFLPNFSHKGK